MEEAAVHIRIEGRVQGVGYRYFAMEKALALGITGWVGNQADGTVEIEARGPHRALENFVKLLAHGPSLARVSHVTTAWHPKAEIFATFDVR